MTECTGELDEGVVRLDKLERVCAASGDSHDVPKICFCDDGFQEWFRGERLECLREEALGSQDRTRLFECQPSYFWAFSGFMF